jgi:hypothetical protein
VTDYRTDTSRPINNLSSNDHNSLINRSILGSHPASAISADSTNFLKFFNSGLTNSQTIYDYLDYLFYYKGTNNYGFGVEALSGNTIGYHNIAIGHKAMSSDIQPSFNIAIGNYSMCYTNGNSTSNVAIGYQSLYNGVNVSSSIAIGYKALLGTVDNTGNNNIAIGSESMITNNAGFNNVAIGSGALYSNNDGYDNFALGMSALFSNYDGFGNIAIGSYALQYIINGSENIGIGYLVLNVCEGNRNIAIGSYSLRDCLNSDYNMAIGFNTLTNFTSGEYNTAIGYESMKTGIYNDNNLAIGVKSLYSINATGNTAIGNYAGYINSTGDYNVYIGYKAGYNHSGSDTLIIDNNDGTTPLVFGDFLNHRIGLGTTGYCDATLHVVGDFKYVDGEQSNGKVLKSDSVGMAHWGAYFSIVEVQNTGYTITLSDVGKTFTCNTGATATFNLPSVNSTHLGYEYTVVKLGSGTVIIDAADSDRIQDSGAGDTIYCSDSGIASITLKLVTSTLWIIYYANGTWITTE